MEKLSDICFGKHYFKVLAVILWNSHLISRFNKTEIDILESVDETLLRRALECPMSTPNAMSYLELGVLPI